MHGSVLGFFAYGALQQSEVAGKDVLEVGSLDVNGSVRPFVQARQPASYVGVDVVPGPGVDRVVDAVDLLATFGPDAFDVVVSTEMLEHADDWQAAIANMVAVLRPGGVLVWTTRSPGFGWHHPPDRWRYTQQAMAEIVGLLNLQLIVLADDPEFPGVFVKARKPPGWLVGQQAGVRLSAEVGERDRVGLADVAAGRAQPAEAGPDGQQLGVVVGAVGQQPTAGTQHAASIARALDGVAGVTPMRESLKILGLPCNPDGTGYYRLWQPLTQLARSSGHVVVVPPPGQHEVAPDEDDIADFDVVARQRPGGRRTLRTWRRWSGLAKLVYEVDDHILDPDPSGLPHWINEEIRETVAGCLELADLVTCSTEPLAAELRRHNPNVVVIPNHVHEDLLTLERIERERVTIGWAGGFTHLQDLVLVQQPLKDLLNGGLKVRRTGRGGLEVTGELYEPDLHMVGHDYRPLVGHRGRFTDWSPNIWSYYEAIDFDIGIAPLHDTAFNRCRSPIKALELAALGIPVVASDIDPYREFVVDGVTGFLCRTEADWYGRLRDLVHDEGMREEMGAKAKAVAAGWTIQQGWRRWADAYETLAGW